MLSRLLVHSILSITISSFLKRYFPVASGIVGRYSASLQSTMFCVVLTHDGNQSAIRSSRRRIVPDFGQWHAVLIWISTSTKEFWRNVFGTLNLSYWAFLKYPFDTMAARCVSMDSVIGESDNKSKLVGRFSKGSLLQDNTVYLQVPAWMLDEIKVHITKSFFDVEGFGFSFSTRTGS